jgi:hypothetical protein
LKAISRLHRFWCTRFRRVKIIGDLVQDVDHRFVERAETDFSVQRSSSRLTRSRSFTSAPISERSSAARLTPSRLGGVGALFAPFASSGSIDVSLHSGLVALFVSAANDSGPHAGIFPPLFLLLSFCGLDKARLPGFRATIKQVVFSSLLLFEIAVICAPRLLVAANG